MLERIQEEIELLQKQYGAIEYGPKVEWILFKEFKLPPGWDRKKTELLVLIPPGYPSTPPDNFYVPVGFKTGNNTPIKAYSEPVPHLGRSWGQFSYHLDGEWHPSANILDGDNVLTFMLKVLERLRELN